MKTMRNVWLSLGAAILIVAYAGSPRAVPAPAPVPAVRAADQWEYCELQFSTRTTRIGGGRGRGGAGGPGGGGGPGGAAPLPVPAVPRMTVRWVTADEEVEAINWEDMAAKMKVPAAKKAVLAATERVRVLNHLGSQGWELISLPASESIGTASWIFKRKVGK